MYLALVVDRLTTWHFFEAHEITPGPSINTELEVLLLSSKSPA